MNFLCTFVGLQIILVAVNTNDAKLCATPQYLQWGKTEVVECSFQEHSYGIYWYNSTDSSNNRPLVVYENSQKSGVEYTSGNYDVFANGSLIINNVSLSDDHYFRVLLLRLPDDDPVTIDIRVHVSVFPDPPYSIVEGCKHGGECVLNVNHEGNLTCSVRRVRPKVELVWLPYPEDDLTHILFFDHKEISIHNGGTHNVSVTSHFKVKDVTKRRLAVECRVSGWEDSRVTLDKKVVLHFANATVQYNDNDKKAASLSWIMLTAAIIGVVLVFSVICSLVVFFVRRQRKPDSPVKKKQHAKKKHNQNNIEEANELISRNPADIRGKKKNFVERLKSTYKEMYTIAPVPFITREKCCVHDFFVRRCLEVRTLNQKETWEQVQSHQDIFQHLSESSRLLLMGENGCGKSTLTLQMAYEWCEERENNFIKKYEIFILLNFMDLVDGKTFFESIRDVLIPNSNKTEKGIQKLFKKFQTGLLIFHGYDKVHNKKDNVHSSIRQIIAGTMFEKFHVMVTTTQYVPENMDLRALHIRLFHFNEREKLEYLEKNIFSKFAPSANTTAEGEEKSVVRKSQEAIKLAAKQNPLLHKLLEVSIFFVLFVNIRNNDTFFTSVVGFFNKMMSSLRDFHAQNKEDEDPFEEFERKLAKVAFDRLLLRDKDNKYLYVNDVMSEIDESVLDRYIQLRVVRTDSSSSTPQKFRFCHDIMLEWYAAKHVQISQKDYITQMLNTVNPNNFPNVFAFICGLRNGSAAFIINKLRQMETCKKEIPLICFLELEKNNVSPTVMTYVLKQVMTTNTIFTLTKDDTKIYQRCILMLEEIVLKHQMGIKNLSLIDCVQVDKCSMKTLVLANDLEIPILQRLAMLHIQLTGQTLKNTQTIFQYCAECGNLKTLKLDSCLLPQTFEKVPPKLSTRKVTVEWLLSLEETPTELKFTNLTWKKSDGKLLTDHDYDALKKKFLEKYADDADQPI